MTTRTTFTLAALVVVAFVIVIATHFRHTDESASLPLGAADNNAAPPAPSMSTPVAPTAKIAQVTQAARPSEEVGTASGNIHFEEQGAGDKSAKIDLDVKAGLALWQPNEHRMRILLLESPPEAGQVARLVDAIDAESLPTLLKRMALIELRFDPTAQAFDRNDVNIATLFASSGTASNTADALQGIDWSGSLPSPQLERPPGSPPSQIELTATGDQVRSDRGTWKQNWRLSLAIPVIMRQ